MASVTGYKICRSDLEDLKTSEPALITEVKPLSSYNWIEAPSATPTIAVPGCPALWTPPGVGLTLERDSGRIFIAQNPARHPESPLEPLFRSLYITCPSFNIRSTNVVTDRHNIRKLLAFVNPDIAGAESEGWSMKIEIRRHTAIFCRNDTKVVEDIGPNESADYGHNFEKAYTTSQISNSTGHYRVISYCFGGLKFVVRYETDGCVNTEPSTRSLSSRHTAESFSTKLERLSQAQLSVCPILDCPGSKLKIRKEGTEVPAKSILEIKTRSRHTEFEEVAAQLWISQTPRLVTAQHRTGYFFRPKSEDVFAEIKEWEARHQDDLSKLAGLVRRIVSLAKQCGIKSTLTYHAFDKSFVICKVEEKDLLPKDLYAKCDDGPNREARIGARNEGVQRPKTQRERGDPTLLCGKCPEGAKHVPMEDGDLAMDTASQLGW